MLIVGVDILGWRSLIWRSTRSWVFFLNGMANAEPRAARSDADADYISGRSAFNYNGRMCLRSQIDKSARTALEEPKFVQSRICLWSEYLRMILQSNLQSFEGRSLGPDFPNPSH